MEMRLRCLAIVCLFDHGTGLSRAVTALLVSFRQDLADDMVQFVYYSNFVSMLIDIFSLMIFNRTTLQLDWPRLMAYLCQYIKYHPLP